MQEITYRDGTKEKKVVDLLEAAEELPKILNNPKVRSVKYYRIPSRKRAKE